MQIRTLVLFFLLIFLLEFVASYFVYFEKGKSINVKDLFQNIPSDFPDNFYIFLLKAKKPHFYNFFYYLFKKELYRENKVSKYKIDNFDGYKFKEQISLYGRSGILAFILSFWSYEKKLRFPKSLKIGIVGDVSEEGDILPVIGINVKLKMAEEEGINVLFLPLKNSNLGLSKINSVYLIFVDSLNEAKKDLLKFVSPKIVNIS